MRTRRPASPGTGSNLGVATPVAELMTKGVELDHYHDGAIEPDRARVRELLREDRVDEDSIVMARMVRAADGASLRTFMGGRIYENGVFCSRKTGRLLHWEGSAARSLIVRCESDHAVVRAYSEAITLIGGPGHQEKYTVDLVIVREDGTEHAVEVKRGVEDLRLPAYRRKLAWAAEVFRRCGIGFSIVYRADVFQTPRHRRNAELVASRGFVHVPRSGRDRVVDLAVRSGRSSTMGEVAETLAPGRRLRGMAMAQALVVGRRLEIDVSARLDERTPVTIHGAAS